MATKVYKIKGMTAGKLYTEFCGNKVELNFVAPTGGLGSNSDGELVTSDRFRQDAIESDSRFGKTIYLAHTYASMQQVANDRQSMTFAPKPNKRMRTQAEIDAELRAMQLPSADTEHAGSQKEEPKPKTSKKSSSKQSASAPPDSGVPTPTEITTVTSLNDAFDYFSSKGILVETKDELDIKCAELNISFPNLTED